MSSFYDRFMTGARRRWRACCAPAGRGLRLVEHLDHGGDIVYRHACKLGCERIASKRLGSPYVSGRTRHWLKFAPSPRSIQGKMLIAISDSPQAAPKLSALSGESGLI
jgi:hypothetical protein